MDFGWYGDDDMAGAVDFVAAQPDVDRGRVAAVGMSMGGEWEARVVGFLDDALDVDTTRAAR